MNDSLEDEEANWSIEVPLSWPFFWKSDTICSFFHEASRVKLEVTVVPNSSDKSREQKSVQLNWKNVLLQLKCTVQLSDADPKLVDYVCSNDVNSASSNEIVTTHFDILTHFYRPDVKLNPKKITASRQKGSEASYEKPMALLTIIRNKYEHFSDMPPMFQKALGWTTDKLRRDGKWGLDKKKFAKYWTSKFPSLLPFLWLQFYEVGWEECSSLNQFYPEFLEGIQTFQENRESLPIDLNGLVVDLNEALQCDLEKGGVVGRYFEKEIVLEFRTVEQKALQRTLDGTSIFVAELSSHGLHCHWYNNYGPNSKPADETKAEFLKEEEDCQNLVIIVGNEVSVMQKIVAEIIVAQTRYKRIIVYAEIGKTKEFLTKCQDREIGTACDNNGCIFGGFKEKPVQWQDLRQSVREVVSVKGRFQVQNKILGLDSLLPNSAAAECANMLSCLEGNLLNQLLREKAAALFDALKVETESELYISRNVFRIVRVRKEVLDTAPNSEIFVIFFDLSSAQVEQVLKREPVTASVRKSDFWYEVKTENHLTIYVPAKETFCSFEQISSSIEGKASKNIHFVRCVHDNLFEWMYTQGSTSFLKASFVGLQPNTSLLEEKEFLSNVRLCWKNGKTVAIVDKPGNGKSTFLKRLATESNEGSGYHLTFFYTMSDLVEKVAVGEVNRENIVDALSCMVGSNNFEKKLCEYWLQSKSKYAQNRIEFFVDALDEVKVDDREKALTILKLIHEFPSVGLCITLRDHFLLDFQKYCVNTQLYRLEAFTLLTQIRFLVEYWQSKSVEKAAVGRDLKKLTDFARECLDLRLAEKDVQIAGTPLICRILAEIYEPYALSGDYRKPFDCTSLNNLYDLMWERKLEIWLEKLEISPVYSGGKEMPAVDASFTEMQNWHTYLAITLIFGKETANKFLSCFFLSEQNLEKMKSTVLQQGIVTSLDPLTFIHQTFAEDLVARFVVTVIDGNIINLKVDNDDFEQFLFYNVLAVEGGDRNPCFKNPTLCYFLNARSQNQASVFPSNFLTKLIQPDLTSSYAREPFLKVIVSASDKKFLDLLTLLLNVSVCVVGFFEFAIENDNLECCKLVLEHGKTAIFDRAVFTRYCKWNSHTVTSLGHWFLKRACMFIFDWQKIFPLMMQNPQFDLERTDSQWKTLLLFVLSLPNYYNVAKKAQILVVDFKANVNAVDNFGNTALHVAHKCTADCVYACTIWKVFDPNEYVKTWESCLKAGLNRDAVNARNDDGETPLLSAVNAFQEQSCVTFQFFKDNEADFDVRDRWGETVLDKAFRMKYKWVYDAVGYTVVKVDGFGFVFDALVKCGANVGDFGITYYGISSLIRLGCPSTVEKLICELGADFQNLTGEGEPLAHQIIRRFNNEVIFNLLESGVNMEVMDADGTSALHLAAMKNVELLIVCVETYKVDVNAKDLHGKTLLHKIRSAELISQMREYGADFNAKDYDGETVLERAIRIADAALVDALVESGADIGGLGKSYEYVFSLAFMGSISVLKEYVHFIGMEFDFEDEVDVKCDKHDAENEESRLKLLRLCVEKHGVNVNSKDKQGKTHLHKTVELGKERFIKLLVELGADINEPDNNGESAIHLAAMKSNELLIYFTYEFAADLNKIGPCGNSAFHHAIESVHVSSETLYDNLHNYKPDSDPIKCILETCDVEAVNSKGQNAFHLVAAADNIYYFDLLCEKFDITFDLKDSNGMTFLDYLVDFRPIKVLCAFLQQPYSNREKYLSNLYQKRVIVN